MSLEKLFDDSQDALTNISKANQYVDSIEKLVDEGDAEVTEAFDSLFTNLKLELERLEEIINSLQETAMKLIKQKNQRW